MRKKKFPINPLSRLSRYRTRPLFHGDLILGKRNVGPICPNHTTDWFVIEYLDGCFKQRLKLKCVDLGSFLLKHHLFSNVDTLLKDSPLSSIRSELKRFTSWPNNRISKKVSLLCFRKNHKQPLKLQENMHYIKPQHLFLRKKKSNRNQINIRNLLPKRYSRRFLFKKGQL